MRTLKTRPGQRVLLAILSFSILGWGQAALAEPFHAVTIDGTITDDGVDWPPVDRIVDDFDDDGGQASGNVRDLWLTWDAQNLYLGLNYQALDRTLVVYLDTGTGTGPDDAVVFAEFPRRLRLPAGRHADLMLAQYHSGFTNLGTLQAWRADDGTGALTEITEQTTNAQTYGVDGSFPDKSVFWFRNEIAIPWSEVYPDGMPARAVLRAVAAVTAAADSSGADDVMPGTGRLEDVDPPIQLTQMRASIVDQDGDGVPDPLDAGVSGTVTLPEDPLTVGVTVTATLTDWSGAALDGPVVKTVTPDDVRTYRAGRLAAGTYTVRAAAPGYFPAETTAVVAAGQELDGLDFTLQKATTITGTLALELGQYPGGYRFLDPGGAELAAGELLPSQFPFDFTFYVSDSGTYTLEAWADNHQAASFDLVVVSGEDLLDLAFTVPRASLVSGVVTFNTGDGADGTVSLSNAEGDSVFATVDISADAPDFTFYAPRLGDLRLTAGADTYLDTELAITVEAGVDLTDLAMPLARMPEIVGAIDFADGPGSAGIIYVTAQGEEALADTISFDENGIVFGTGGETAPFYVPEGVADVIVDAPGYGLWTDTVSLTGGDTTTDLGMISLEAVRADRLRMIDETGAEIISLSATKSIHNPTNPDSSTYFPEAILLEAVGADDRRDLFDLDAKLTGLELTARKLNDVAAPLGSAWFLGSYATDNVDDIIATVDVSAGTTQFWLANEAIEVLRVFVGPEVPDPLKQDPEPPTARIMIGFNDPRPATVVLSVDRDTLMAHADSTLTIEAQLYDTAGNLSKQVEIVSFTTLPTSAGRGAFALPSVETNSNGYATATLRATGAGELLIDCSAVVDNQVLEVRLDDVDGEPGPLAVTVIPGPTTAWDVSLATGVSGLAAPVTVAAQTVDAFGNATAEPDETVQLTATPAALGTFSDAAPVTDDTGRATSAFQPAGPAGVVTIGGSSASYAGDEADLELRDVIVVSDPTWDQEPASSNSFSTVDLTALVLNNTPDALTVDIPFSSDWTGLQFHLLFETAWDAAGGASNAFDMPVQYGHERKPDYVLNLKFDQSYGDLRKWNEVNPDWRNWWDTDSETYLTDYASTVEIQSRWATFADDGIQLVVPWGPFGGRPDSLRCELYVTQVYNGDNRSALDSVPSDATLDLDWDPDDPDGNWSGMTSMHTLTNWSPTYVVRTDFPTPPTVSAANAEPSELEAGSLFTLSARVEDAGDGVGDVLADLSAIAGAPLARMHDDGEEGHGDDIAGDGIYSLRSTVPLGSPGGEHELHVTAFEGTNLLASRDTAQVDVTAQVDIIVQAGFTADEIGDDHGPNQSGVEGLYYTYPTNSVFVTGAFDLLGLNIYETVATVGSDAVEMIAFEVSVGDFPDPDDPHTADWNPPYSDLNIQKIDIMIDTGPGGATRGLPNRRIDFQRWNAWDYAIIIDGWYKAVVPSLSQNTEDAWRANAQLTDADIILTGDFERDVITALVAKSALGNPTPEDIERWSMAVVMCSHDGDADFGGVRWVNESRSEWNQGGGHYQDRDPNVMDMILIPGANREAGRTQEEMLNYESEFALRRLDEGETPCAVEMSAFEDTGPPVINVVKDFGEVMLREPLEGAPVAFTIEIVDDNEVGSALFSYRSSVSGDGTWDVADVPMGYVGDDLWSVDLPADWLDTALVYSPVDSMRYVEFQIYAEDIDYLDYEATGTLSPVTTVQVSPARDRLSVTGPLGADDTTLRHVEGSALTVDGDLAWDLLEYWRETTGTDVSADSLATFLELGWDISTVEPMISSAPTVPRATPLGIYRGVELYGTDGETVLPLEGRLPGTAALGLHYTDDHLPAGRAESKIAVYEHHAGSDRWVLAGGHVNERANKVTVTTDHAGVYGLFWSEDLEIDTGEVISGITVSPNPFSPNGDGLYDRTSIGFYLTQEATVTVEVYNIEGRLKRRLQETFPYSGDDDANRVPRRVEGLIWDGTGSNGEYVPYGIYILRLIVTYNQAGGQRTIRSNHAVAVIR